MESTFEARRTKAEQMNDGSDAQSEPAVDLPAVIAVFEAILCFDPWMNQATYWTAQHHAESKLVVQKELSEH